jgi:hypothetical protein
MIPDLISGIDHGVRWNDRLKRVAFKELRDTTAIAREDRDAQHQDRSAIKPQLWLS